MDDPRYIKLRKGLEQLNSEQLKRLRDSPLEMVYDEVNYDAHNDLY